MGYIFRFYIYFRGSFFMDIIINVSLSFIVLSFVLYLAGYVIKKQIFDKLAFISYFISFLWLCYFFIYYFIKTNRLPLSNQFESLIILCLGVFLISVWFYFKYEKEKIIFFSASLVISVMLSLLNLIEPSMKPLMPALRSNWLFFHVLTSMLAYSFFALAAFFSIFWFFYKNSKKDISLRIIKSGFAMLTIGIITGSVWAETAWGRYWSWDPKETWSLITWFYYAGFLHISKKGMDDKKIAVLSFIGIIIVMFTYFGVNYLMSGLHSYA